MVRIYTSLQGRHNPDSIKITQDIPGSEHANVKWSFPVCKDLVQLKIQVIKEDIVVQEIMAAASSRCQAIAELSPSVKYIIKIIAEYNDGLSTEGQQEYINCGIQAT